MILLKLIRLPFRLTFGTARVSARTGYRAGRVVGYGRLVVLGIGVGAGLLLAPRPGRELRSALRRRLEARGLTDAALDERVRFELAHHPRTWHLPQPEVSVVERRVTLTGDIPDEDARTEVVRACAALPGVAGVDDRLVVRAGTGTQV